MALVKHMCISMIILSILSLQILTQGSERVPGFFETMFKILQNEGLCQYCFIEGVYNTLLSIIYS